MSVVPERSATAATAEPRHAGTRVGRRVLWGAADQGVYGLTNTFLTVMVATSVGRRSFGAFSVVLMMYSLTIGTVQGLVSEAFTVTHGSAEDADPHRELGAAAGCALALGVLVGILAWAASFLATGPLRSCLLAFAIVVPVMYLQDTWRFALFALGRPHSAFLNDVAWAVVQGVGVAVAVATHHASASAFILAWGGGALVGALLGMWQTRTVPRPALAWWWIRRHWALGGRYAGEFLTLFGAAQVVLSVVAVTSGLAELGRIRAGGVLYAPLQGLVNAARLAVTSVAVQVWAQTPTRLGRFVTRMGIALTVAALACGAAAVVLPDSIGRALLGASWPGLGPVLVPLALMNAFLAGSIGAITALRAMRASRQSFRVRLALAVVTLLAGSVGAIVGGAVGAAWGLAGAGLFGLVLMTVVAKRTLTEHLAAVRPSNPAVDAGFTS